MANKKKLKEDKEDKEYIVTYRSEEHFEVLGWLKADSLQKAKKKAKQILFSEAKKYEVKEAEIAEWRDGDEISFEIGEDK